MREDTNHVGLHRNIMRGESAYTTNTKRGRFVNLMKNYVDHPSDQRNYVE